MDLLTLDTLPGIQANPVPSMIILFGVFGFTGLALLAMVFYWRKHARNANTDFQRASLMRLMWLTGGVLTNMCVLPMVMIFCPIIWVRILSMLVQGVLLFLYLKKNWNVPIMFVDPAVVSDIKQAINQDIKPALDAIPVDQGVDQHVMWSKTGADKLSHLIEKLRAPDAS